jgi:hypothetical protein
MRIRKILNNLKKNILKSMMETIMLSTELILPKKVVIDRDWMLLSKNFLIEKINELLDAEKIIVCNLKDRDGKIGLNIIEIKSDLENEIDTLILKGDIKCPLSDKYLYNLIYNTKLDKYSLEEHDEYYEKIEIER